MTIGWPGAELVPPQRPECVPSLEHSVRGNHGTAKRLRDKLWIMGGSGSSFLGVLRGKDLSIARMEWCEVEPIKSFYPGPGVPILGGETELDILSDTAVEWRETEARHGITLRATTEGVACIKIENGRDVWQYVADSLNFPKPTWAALTIAVTIGGWDVVSDKIRIHLNKTSHHMLVESDSSRFVFRDFTRDHHALRCQWELDREEHLYGLGEKVGALDKRGRFWTQWTTDVSPHTESTDAMYQAHPFALVGSPRGFRGLFLASTTRSYWDATEEGSLGIGVDDGPLTLYCLPGPSPASVLARFTGVVGRMPMPPKYALGFHQSRWSYQTQEEVLDIVHEFRQRDIPLDVIHLDIDYMAGYRVFTTNHETFPDMDGVASSLAEQGCHLVAIIDPGVKVDAAYPVYEEGGQRHFFLTFLNGQEFQSRVWPGLCAFPDFSRQDVRDWWADLNTGLARRGIAGIWNDMNEPAVWGKNPEHRNMQAADEGGLVHMDDQGEEIPHHEVHNVYALFQAAATYAGLSQVGQRPFILSRAGFSGIQRFATVWTGDNSSTWDHLKMAIPMCLNMGLSGVAFVGPDIGGFLGDAPPELYARWIEMGVFFPFARAHTERGTLRHEPWSFGTEVENIAKQYIRYRYRLLPYLYSVFYESHRTGVPIMRPIWWSHPTPTAMTTDDEFMVGDFILVAPVIEDRARARTVYLPSGQWYNVWTQEMMEGEQNHHVNVPFDQLPVFIKAGAIIPLADNVSSTQEWAASPWPSLVRVIPGNGQWTFYIDDGQSSKYQEGEYLTIAMKIQCQDSGGLEFQWHHEHRIQQDQDWLPKKPVVLSIGPVPTEPHQVCVNGRLLNRAAWHFTDQCVQVSVDWMAVQGLVTMNVQRTALLGKV